MASRENIAWDIHRRRVNLEFDQKMLRWMIEKKRRVDHKGRTRRELEDLIRHQEGAIKIAQSY